jgi:16S rRNA (cytosine1402-N4)-methyltransferase
VVVSHTPVLPEQVCSYLSPSDDSQLMVDATVGEGGYGELFLSRFSTLRMVGVDADAEILRIAQDRLAGFGRRISFVNDWFDAFFADYPLDERPQRVLFDFGISMHHFERSGRGFSFQGEEPLDMRLNLESSTTAGDIVNELEENELADLLYNLADERYSRRIARRIVAARETKRIESAEELADIVRGAVPPAYRHGRIHPATRTFQALRIQVNDELGRIERGLRGALSALQLGGILAAISFHSLEDAITKRSFRQWSKGCTCPPGVPMCTCGGVREVQILTRKPVRPDPEEIERNPASRSARLRVVRKVAEPGAAA